MVNHFFEHPFTLRYLREGVTGPHMDAFAAALADQGFTVGRARALLCGVAHLGHWLQKRRTPLVALDEGVVEAFRAHLSRCRCVRRNKGRLYYCRSGSNRFLAWAREQDLVRTPSPAERVPLLIRNFEAWMLQHRNVAPSTLTVAYRLHLRRFLAAAGNDPGGYDAAGIRAFVLAQSQRTRPSSAKKVVTPVRMLLRYLAVEGRCKPELVDAVPTVAHWRLGSLPRYLSREVVDKIVASCDRRTVRGRRDRAVLLLLTRLGLRAGDVAALRLGDLDWSRAAMTVFGKSRRGVRLPLPQEVGDAILAWLSRGRTDRYDDHVFFGLRAPIGPLTRSKVAMIVESAARRAGVMKPRVGPNLLRHSAATAWLRDGMSLPAIGGLLRHQSPDTTAIYAKVDTDLLNTVARPWPEEVSP
jgi:integrase/recombinase XerD